MVGVPWTLNRLMAAPLAVSTMRVDHLSLGDNEHKEITMTQTSCPACGLVMEEGSHTNCPNCHSSLVIPDNPGAALAAGLAQGQADKANLETGQNVAPLNEADKAALAARDKVDAQAELAKLNLEEQTALDTLQDQAAAGDVDAQAHLAALEAAGVDTTETQQSIAGDAPPVTFPGAPAAGAQEAVSEALGRVGVDADSEEARLATAGAAHGAQAAQEAVGEARAQAPETLADVLGDALESAQATPDPAQEAAQATAEIAAQEDAQADPVFGDLPQSHSRRPRD